MDIRKVKKRIQNTLQSEIRAVTALEEKLGKDFANALSILEGREGKIVVTGVGKSGFIGMKMSATLVSLGHDAVFLNPLDALHGDSGMVRNGDVLILFSYSGGSSELVKLVKHFRKHFKVQVVTVTGKKNSVLAKLSDGVVDFSIEDEGCPIGLAPMASTTASLVIADCIASALTSPEKFGPEHFAKFHPAGTLGLSLTSVDEVMRTGTELPIIEENLVFEEVLTAITESKNTQIVGVVDKKGKLVGAVADGDVRRMLLQYGDLRGKSASFLMNKKPRTISPDHSLFDALTFMHEHMINSLLVVDRSGHYVGFIHMHDIIDT